MLVFTLVWIICGLIGMNFMWARYHKEYRKELDSRSYFDGRRLCTYTEELEELNKKHKITNKGILKGLIIGIIVGPLVVYGLRK